MERERKLGTESGVWEVVDWNVDDTDYAGFR